MKESSGNVQAFDESVDMIMGMLVLASYAWVNLQQGVSGGVELTNTLQVVHLSLAPMIGIKRQKTRRKKNLASLVPRILVKGDAC